MTPTTTIVLTEYEALAPRGPVPPGGKPRLRRRWQARFDGSPLTASANEIDEAIGRLVRARANQCDTADEIIDLLAGLFGDLSVRTADVTLGRALRIAAKHPHRRHPGCAVRLQPLAAAAGTNGTPKGGAA